MKLVLSVSSGNEFCDGGCEFALVDLTPELGAMALRRIDVLKEQKKSDGSLLETYSTPRRLVVHAPAILANQLPLR